MNDRLKNIIGWTYTIAVVIWLIGMFVLTPIFTAKHTVKVCKQYSPDTVDVYSAGTMGLMMGFLWPVTLVVDYGKK